MTKSRGRPDKTLRRTIIGAVTGGVFAVLAALLPPIIDGPPAPSPTSCYSVLQNATNEIDSHPELADTIKKNIDPELIRECPELPSWLGPVKPK